MPEPIPDYYVAEFPTPGQAEKTARAIADGCLALGMEDEADHALRGVIWCGPPTSVTGTLYLSVGALQIAHEIGVPVVPTRRISAAELPGASVLLLGTTQDRSASRPDS